MPLTKNGLRQTLCEPVQSICTWTSHKSQPMRKCTGHEMQEAKIVTHSVRELAQWKPKHIGASHRCI